MLKFDPERPVAAPKDAATLLVVRDTADDALEIFCVRRHGQSAFMGGAVVFPGGKLDEADGDPRFRHLSTSTHRRCVEMCDDKDHALALAVCACRESLEEATLLPCRPTIDDARVRELHEQLKRTDDFVGLLEREGLRLTTDALIPFARWITPEAEQRRFDARFFLTPAPAEQSGRHDEKETVSSVWATPQRLLEAFHAGDLFLAPPTLRCIELLSQTRTADQAIALCQQQSLLPICPQFVPSDPPMLTLPGDPEHELEEPRVAGGTRFVLRDGKFVSE